MKIPQCFLSPVFSTSQWQLPFQKESPSGNLATRIVSWAFIVIFILPFFKNNIRRVELKLFFQREIGLHEQNEPSDLDVYCLVVFSWELPLQGLKLQPLVLNIPGFHILLLLAPACIFTAHCRQSQNQKQEPRIFGWNRGYCTLLPGGLHSASCLPVIFDTGTGSVHLRLFISVTSASTAERGRRRESHADVRVDHLWQQEIAFQLIKIRVDGGKK